MESGKFIKHKFAGRAARGAKAQASPGLFLPPVAGKTQPKTQPKVQSTPSALDSEVLDRFRASVERMPAGTRVLLAKSLVPMGAATVVAITQLDLQPIVETVGWSSVAESLTSASINATVFTELHGAEKTLASVLPMVERMREGMSKAPETPLRRALLKNIDWVQAQAARLEEEALPTGAGKRTIKVVARTVKTALWLNIVLFVFFTGLRFSAGLLGGMEEEPQTPPDFSKMTPEEVDALFRVARPGQPPLSFYGGFDPTDQVPFGPLTPKSPFNIRLAPETWPQYFNRRPGEFLWKGPTEIVVDSYDLLAKTAVEKLTTLNWETLDRNAIVTAVEYFVRETPVRPEQIGGPGGVMLAALNQMTNSILELMAETERGEILSEEIAKRRLEAGEEGPDEVEISDEEKTAILRARWMGVLEASLESRAGPLNRFVKSIRTKAEEERALMREKEAKEAREGGKFRDETKVGGFGKDATEEEVLGFVDRITAIIWWWIRGAMRLYYRNQRVVNLLDSVSAVVFIATVANEVIAFALFAGSKKAADFLEDLMQGTAKGMSLSNFFGNEDKKGKLKNPKVNWWVFFPVNWWVFFPEENNNGSGEPGTSGDPEAGSSNDSEPGTSEDTDEE